MYQHTNCLGAECPWCSPFSIVQAPSNHGQAEGATRLLDSCGEPLRAGIMKVVPSATVVVVHGAHFREGPPWTIVIHQRRDNGRWALPGGAMEPGECIQTCAEREVYEETGLTVYLETLTSVDSDPEQYAVCQYPDGNVIQYCNLTFLAQVVSGVVQRSEESLDVRWCRTDQLPAQFLPLHQWRLARAMDAIQTREIVVR